MSSVTVIIPALNEKDSIRQVLAEIPAGTVDQTIVVDGGSTDGTPDLARAAGAQVVHEPRRGYGRACAAGLAAASGDLVLFMDADGADDPGQIPDLLQPVFTGRADMVLGSRLAGDMQAGAMPWQQSFGNWLAARLIRGLYGLPLTDLGTFRAVRRQALLDLGMVEMTYGWPTEMIVKAARCGWQVLEVPVDYRSRLGGQSKISGTLRGTVLAAWHILGTVFRYAIVLDRRPGNDKKP